MVMRLEPRALFNLIHKFIHSLFIKLNLLHLTPLDHYARETINKSQPFCSHIKSIIYTAYLYQACSSC